MKRTTLMILMITLLAFTANAQDIDPVECPGDGTGSGNGNGPGMFVDADGDGFNDLAPDADGDGIPNGLDDDFVKPEDGTGAMHRHGQAVESGTGLFGEGMGQGKGQGMGGNRHGLGDGTGTGVGPRDGSGFGPGTGDCTGDLKETVSNRGNRGRRG